VAAAHGDEVVGAALVGSPDVEAATGDRVEPLTTAYRVGSITKTFTAAVVLLVAERGALELDAPVGSYLDGTGFGRVPVRALLAHCGGLPREVPLDMWESMRGPDTKALRAAFGDVQAVDRPWARWHYSNLGYAVLGQVLEEVAGASCPELIDGELLGPLGLTGTVWSRPPKAAVGYRLDPYADRVHVEPVMDQGAIGVGGQLWSTAADLLRWGDALAGGAPDVLPEPVVESMNTVQVMVDRQAWTSAWGLGLILERRDGRVLAGHTGAMPGFLSALWVDRGSRSVAVALTNTTRGVAIADVAAEALDLVLAATPEPVGEPWRPAPPCPPELEGVLGRWWSEADETVFSWRADGLHAHLASAPTTSETRFAPEAEPGGEVFRAVAGRMAGERLRIRRDGRGEVVGLEWATYPFTRSPR
jgi:CubicO group peptidase (beta-lactamase class C family)